MASRRNYRKNYKALLYGIYAMQAEGATGDDIIDTMADDICEMMAA